MTVTDPPAGAPHDASATALRAFDITGNALPIGAVLGLAAAILRHEVDSDRTFGYPAALEIGAVDTGSSVEVVGLVSGGAADQAGITTGSTITAIDGASITALADLTDALARLQPGDAAVVAWTDAQGTAREATVELGTAPLG